MAHLFSCRLALIAFATAVLRGVLTAGQFEGTLKTALAAAVAFYVVGLICGELARRVVEEDAQAEVERLIAGIEEQNALRLKLISGTPSETNRSRQSD